MRCLVLGGMFAMLLAAFPGTAKAVIANPNSSIWNNDNQAQMFTHSSAVVGVEVVDVFGGIAGWSSSFGFFFGSDTSTLIPIFGPEDQGAALSQKALIDFNTGVVSDVDDANVQSVFTSSMDAIGFYLDIVNPAGAELILYTLNSLNPGGMDLAATFGSKANSSLYLVGFEVPGVGIVGFDLIGGIKPVPEPGTFLLMGAGLAFAGLRLRKRNCR